MDRRNTNETETGCLARRAQGGDTRAYDALVRRFQDGATAFCAARLDGDFRRAEDAAQDAFVEAFQTLSSLRQPEAFVGWLRLLLKKHCDRQTR